MEVEINDENYAGFKAQNKPMVIDFSAAWCGPCKKMAPIIENLANTYGDQVIVGKVDIDDCPELVSEFSIRNIPTIVFVKGGQIVDKTVGSVPASEVENKLKALL